MEESPHYTTDSFIPVFARGDNLSQSCPRNIERRPYEHRSENRDNFKSRSNALIHSPWKVAASYSCGVIGLHEEINDFYEAMRPTEQETEIRLKVVEHITRTVHSLWPQAKVEVFGSFRTGLYLSSSDIDMVIFGEWKSIPLSTLGRALESNGVLSSDINIIANASVPIIRLLHSPSKIRVDISFNMNNGVKSAKMIKNLMKEFPPLPKLVLVLKQFLVHRGLNEVYNGGMSSYCLTLLIVSFLQGYHKPKTLPSSNLGTLLIEFFELYGINFNYERVSIHFQNGGNYQPRNKAGNFLSVEDPLVGGHDVAKGTYLMHLLKMSFQNAFYVLSKAVNESAASKTQMDSFLQLILTVDGDVLSARQSMQQNCKKIIRTLSRLLENSGENQTLLFTPRVTSESTSFSTPASNFKPKYTKKKRIR